METRKPAVAGQFYPLSEKQCLDEIKEYCPDGYIEGDLPAEIVAGIVPHAGWVFSGDLAALVFSAIKQTNPEVDTFVIFGAVHSYMDKLSAVYNRGKWQTPLGQIAIDEDLADEIAATKFAHCDCHCHFGEHSIEVQVPFVQYLFPDAKIVPIMVPPGEWAVLLGLETARIISQTKDKVIACIASTDLTHYGPRYGFYPEGPSPEGIKWAKKINDNSFIDLALQMDAEKMLESAIENTSACGPGASAALVAAAKELGKTKGLLLAHTHSNEVMQKKFNQTSEESVGYAAIVF